ncbi:helix-turn-helix domain-containing protein [Maricaulis sp.]|uniref:helix-turn-helix domain-containing protein n=1 Tax=Maricaulis sp. TaxID=1486257 RepID=UPI0026383EA7|nr:helix-turn-helix domain-containing protein [Maricaulis sp.]
MTMLIANSLKLMVASAAIVWIIAMLRRGAKSQLEISWAVFCGAMGVVMIEEVFGAAMGRYALLLGIAGGATCSIFWLVTRSLFRPGNAVGPIQIALVTGIFLPALISRSMRFFETEQWIGAANQEAILSSLSNFQLLLASTALMLCFAEATRGYATLSKPERHLRWMFLGTFGVCVTACMVLPMNTTFPPELAAITQAFCATSIMATMSIALRYRLSHPLAADAPAAKPAPAPATAEERALGQRIEALLANETIYLESDLKVAGLAKRLMEPDYKVSRAISAGLEQPNFNRFINRYRIQHAQNLLADPRESDQPILEIALASGFASLGPFNRAFKDRTGLTPRAYRSECQAVRSGELLASAE